MERMVSVSRPPVQATPVATNSLSTRLSEFVCNPDNGCTFGVWHSRYEDVISKDGATLDDAAKARPIVSKLDSSHTPVSPTTFSLKERAMFP
ncbi:hypothetical protein RB195_002549 [Necator americanus]|uniref:DUF7083 domain-containing protein n=1 Tax=Necator americanus TaxID=51031 RepID=A0ABR1DJZ8_NECAM